MKEFEVIYYDKDSDRIADRTFKAENIAQALVMASGELALIQGNALVTEVDVEELLDEVPEEEFDAEGDEE